MNIMQSISRLVNELRSLFSWFIKRKLAIAIFFIFLLAFPVYAYFVTVVRPAQRAGELLKIKPGVELDTAKSSFDLDSESLKKIAATENLELEKAYLENRLELAKKSDSVYLSLDLTDSLLNLEIKGVVVRSCPLTGLEVSMILAKIDYEDKLKWVSNPFNLQSDFSTIPKIPYVIKEAPKDSVEAQEQSAIPIPPDTTSVYFTLYFDKNLVLEVEQSEPPNRADQPFISDYRRETGKKEKKAAWNSFFRGKVPVHAIRISLAVSSADARAIYRGIPVNASLALRLNQ